MHIKKAITTTRCIYHTSEGKTMTRDLLLLLFVAAVRFSSLAQIDGLTIMIEWTDIS